MLKLVFAGTPDVAVPSLKAFAADPRFDVVGVITRPDAPTGVAAANSRPARSRRRLWSSGCPSSISNPAPPNSWKR